MVLFRSVDISSFRGLRNATLNSLGGLNLVTGLNGAGKSALLEAMFILSAPDKPELSNTVLAFRSIDRFALAESDLSQTPWDSLFPYGSALKEIRLSAVMRDGLVVGVEVTNAAESARIRPAAHSGRVTPRPSSMAVEVGQRRGMKWVTKKGKSTTTRMVYLENAGDGSNNAVKVEPPSRVPQQISAMRLPHTRIDNAELAERFGNMELAGNSAVVLQALQEFDPRVAAIRTIYNRTGPLLHVDIGLGKLLPITLMGGGFTALAEIVIDMHECRGGLLLLDEVESGFHFSVMRDVWRVIAQSASQFDVQVVASTHSIEFIRGALAGNSSVEGEFNLYRIDRLDQGESSVTSYLASEVDSAISLGLDVR